MRDPHLETIAHQVAWWEKPEVTLAGQDEFLCRVMARGQWNDLRYVEKIYGEEAFRKALKNAKPGVIDISSWHYWHHRLGIDPVPGLPVRAFA